MTRTRRVAMVAVPCLLLAAAWATMRHVDTLRWRADVIGLKLRGGIDDLSWPELAKMLRPGSDYDLRSMPGAANVYAAIVNPFASEIASGAELFRSECTRCHGESGTGGTAPNLTAGNYRHGESDWAVFRTITRGIPGTAMSGQPLTDRQAWQLVAFVRSLSETAARPIASHHVPAGSPVTDERLRAAATESESWLTYSGTYDGARYSRLNTIDQKSVGSLRLKWLYQFDAGQNAIETTPLVVDGVMFLTEPPANVLALEAATGRLLWKHQRRLPVRLRPCCGLVNRGAAVFGPRVYAGTMDGHLLSLDRATGKVAWDVEVANPIDGYSITAAPLAAGGKILIGVAGGEFGIRGFVDAYDPATGRRAWRFYTVPGPGEPGHQTWSGDSWRTGGGPTWLPGSFDPELNLVYWGVGNPAPGFNGDGRQGDNLYTDSVIALDVSSGRLRWHFQFTPHDEHEWDANQIPVLVDRTVAGVRRRLIVWANRNGFFYVLDRETGRFLSGRPFVKQTWAERLTDEGRPIVLADSAPSVRGTLVWPGNGGGANWWSPSYSPMTDLFYVQAHEQAAVFVRGSARDRQNGEFFVNGVHTPASGGTSVIRALDAESGDLAWEYQLASGRAVDNARGGLLSTAGNVVFGGNGEGLFVALDAKSGSELWRTNMGGPIWSSPITFTSEGKQLVTVAAGRTLITLESR